MQFYNRAEAGKALGERLTGYANRPEVLILALQGGGIPIASEVSRMLNVPADILVVRKLRLPEESDIVIGAITSGKVQVLNDTIVHDLELTPSRLETIVEQAEVELAAKEQKFRGARPFSELEGRTVIVVDDGLGTGSSMRVALEAIKQRKPGRIVIALPVAPPSVYYDFQSLADEIVCLFTPADFGAVRNYYTEFLPVTEEETQKLLALTAQKVAKV
ncbi:MAG TPA: phosphoribosyltransferase family protein [Chloroflexia bacterium]|nr:phosphoribosyltransferase family protein [Chloroflexia bacterium]